MAGKLILAVVLAALGFTLGGCPRSRHSSDHPAVLRLSQRNEPADLDPATATLPDEFFIIRALSEGLVSPAPEAGQVSAAAAEKWKISADGLSYTFHLRADGRWSNDEPVTAQDFIDSYRRALTPATISPKAPLFYAVKNARAFVEGKVTDFSQVGFKAVGALTLIITLEHPSPVFLTYVASGPWIPVNPRAVARFGRNWTQPANFVGNGPFVLTEWQPHQRIVVKKNPRYAPPIELDEIQFIRFDSGDTEERSYRAGQVDVTMAVPFSKIETYRRERPAELHVTPLAETRYLSLNVTRPPLNDRRVRLALSMALDRKKIVERVLLGGQQPAYDFIPPFLRTAPAPPALLHESATKARLLLEEAGFPDGKGFPTLEFSTWNNSPVLEAIQAMWKKELGINVVIANREARVHLAALRSGNYDIAFITAIPDVPDAFNLLQEFTTGAASNYPHLADPAFDALIEAAGQESAPAERARQLSLAEERLIDSAAVIPVYFNAKNWLMQPRVKNWQEDALWTRFYKNIQIDEN